MVFGYLGIRCRGIWVSVFAILRYLGIAILEVFGDGCLASWVDLGIGRLGVEIWACGASGALWYLGMDVFRVFGYGCLEHWVAWVLGCWYLRIDIWGVGILGCLGICVFEVLGSGRLWYFGFGYLCAG